MTKAATLCQTRIQGVTNKNSVYVTKTEDVKKQRLPVSFSSNIFLREKRRDDRKGQFLSHLWLVTFKTC